MMCFKVLDDDNFLHCLHNHGQIQKASITYKLMQQEVLLDIHSSVSSFSFHNGIFFT
jgi:hypothetical protein